MTWTEKEERHVMPLRMFGADLLLFVARETEGFTVWGLEKPDGTEVANKNGTTESLDEAKQRALLWTIGLMIASVQEWMKP